MHTNYEREKDWRKRGIIGCTVALYNELFEAQNGVCGICLKPPTNRALSVDHSHAITDRFNVRGLLHQTCNYKLGMVEKGIYKPNERELCYLAKFGLEVMV